MVSLTLLLWLSQFLDSESICTYLNIIQIDCSKDPARETKQSRALKISASHAWEGGGGALEQRGHQPSKLLAQLSLPEESTRDFSFSGFLWVSLFFFCSPCWTCFKTNLSFVSFSHYIQFGCFVFRDLSHRQTNREVLSPAHHFFTIAHWVGRKQPKLICLPKVPTVLQRTIHLSLGLVSLFI